MFLFKKIILLPIKLCNKIYRDTKDCGISISNFFQPFPEYFYNYWISYFPSSNVRLFFLKTILKYQIGRKTFIHLGCFFCGKDIKIGSNSVIGRNVYLGSPVEIGNNVSITAQSYIFASTHFKDSPTFEGYAKKIFIDDYAWIGARAVILPDVIIRRGTIVGANSTVTKSTAPLSIVVGSPAKLVSMRDEKALQYELNYFPSFN